MENKRKILFKATKLSPIFYLEVLHPDRISKEELIAIMDKELSFPGVSNAWTMPIKTRIDMLIDGTYEHQSELKFKESH
jgi:Cu/Ag efflux pump CusA